MIRRPLRPFVRVPNNSRWVFIVGCYGSGTTLLHDLLAASPDCAALPGEGAFFTRHLITPEQLGWTRMWWKVEDRMRAFGNGGGERPDIVRRDWGIWYDTSRPVFLEKSISNAIRIPWLARSFPGARFIHLVRNGYAVAEGIRRRGGRSTFGLPEGLTTYPIEWCARQWVRSNEVITEDLAHLASERALTLRYEELCADPKAILAAVGRFAEIGGLDASPVDRVRDVDAEAIARLEPEDVRLINEVAADQLRTWGYDVLEPSRW